MIFKNDFLREKKIFKKNIFIILYFAILPFCHLGSTPGDASAAFKKCQTFFGNYFLNIIFENYF
jgi:hypothetical protein